MPLKLPDRLLFNARSEGIERSRFGADAFRNHRAITPITHSQVGLFDSQ
ncbi:hypothetical protein JAO29_05995 [Edaphobacter sp. HDX4]